MKGTTVPAAMPAVQPKTVVRERRGRPPAGAPGSILLAAALVLVLAAAGCGGDDSGDGDGDGRREPVVIRSAPPELDALYRSPRLQDGDTDAFRRQLTELRGHPVVVNKWASWCGPCRDEFPYFQRAAARHGHEVAFLGVDSNDTDEAAASFLEDFPVPYPSYSDPDVEIADEFVPGAVGWPATAFYDAKGELVYVHQGPYESAADLSADIRRYRN